MNAIDDFFKFDPVWQMDNSERFALLAILDYLKPALSLEIGSRHGGSLARISKYSKRVISLDIDPTVPVRLGHFTNVEFVVGDSRKTLPALLGRLQKEGTPLQFALVDGDHTTEGALADCQHIIAVRPLGPLIMLIHDSFNPDVRKGIESVAWRECPYVHALEMDLIPGVISAEARLRREMWGGFALAILKPEERIGPLQISAMADLSYKIARPLSVHHLLTRRILQIGGKFRGSGGNKDA